MSQDAVDSIARQMGSLCGYGTPNQEGINKSPILAYADAAGDCNYGYFGGVALKGSKGRAFSNCWSCDYECRSPTFLYAYAYTV